jgi:hypothetical protein
LDESLTRLKRARLSQHTLDELMQVNDQKQYEEEVLELVTAGKPIYQWRNHGDDN